MTDKKLLDGKVEVRPTESGSFDELVMYDGKGISGKNCLVHAEMMDDINLWIGFYPPGETERSVFMNVGIKDGKLHIVVEENE